ncbi:MAG: hypothetical protein AAB152_10895 [Candidatus Coatesbacteria bacterium]
MTSDHESSLSFLSCRIALSADSGEPLEAIKSFFSSHFAFADLVSAEPVLAHVHLTRSPFPSPSSIFDHADVVFLRLSDSPFFTIPGRRTRLDGEELVRCDKSGTVIRYRGSEITVHVQESGYGLDLIELIRDLVFKDLERTGVLILHSTVVARDGRAVLIVGGKGAGKSTIALHLATRHGFAFMSGDKAFISVDRGRPMVAGWPDYPHIGVGTLRDLPDLAPKFGMPLSEMEGLSPSDKVELSPHKFRQAIVHTGPGGLLPVDCVLYPRVDPLAASSVSAIGNHRVLLDQNTETAFGLHSGWNSFQEPAPVALAPLIEQVSLRPGWRVEGIGVPDLSWFDSGKQKE